MLVDPHRHVSGTRDGYGLPSFWPELPVGGWAGQLAWPQILAVLGEGQTSGLLCRRSGGEAVGRRT